MIYVDLCWTLLHIMIYGTICFYSRQVEHLPTPASSLINDQVLAEVNVEFLFNGISWA